MAWYQTAGDKISGTCTQRTRPSFYRSGVKEGMASAVYMVDTNVPVPGEAILAYAWQWAPDPLPIRGSAFIDQRSSVTRSWSNPDIFALDYDMRPIGYGAENFKDHWEVVVTWRPPQWGQDEVPATINLAPHARLGEYKFEYRDYSELRTQGYTPAATGTDLEDIVNTAGYPLQPESITRRQVVVRIMYNVYNVMYSVLLSEKLEGTTNKEKFKIGTGPTQTTFDDEGNVKQRQTALNVEKHHARWLGCDQWEAGYWGGYPYYRVEERIEIARSPYYIRRLNEGMRDKDGNTPETSDGKPIPGAQLLTEDGEFYKDSEPVPIWRDYRVLREENFAHTISVY